MLPKSTGGKRFFGGHLRLDVTVRTLKGKSRKHAELHSVLMLKLYKLYVARLCQPLSNQF